MFLPKLAKALGSCERAIVLQQIHWLCMQPNSGKVIDGHHWVWGTYEEWCKDYFLMWSPHTLRKHIQKLEEDECLISSQPLSHQHDRTKFYRVNYEHEYLSLTGMRPDAVASKEPDMVASKRPDVIESERPHVIASKEQHAVASIYRTETSSKTSSEKGSDADTDKMLSTMLQELGREVAPHSPAHEWLKGCRLVKVSGMVYRLHVLDAKGVEWLSQQLAEQLRKKLSVLVGKRVDLEIVSAEKEMA